MAGISDGTSTSYSYDGAGNRLRAVRGGTEIGYIYDAVGNLLAEADSSNIITRYYIHGAGLLAALTPADAVYCYHFDGVGSTAAITDSSQGVVNSYAYTPFGMLLNESEAFAQPFKYVGSLGVMAEDNGFYYMRARYYDPEVGRFISEDPIGFGGGYVNLYVYCLNNPILYVDPLGLEIWVMNRKAHGIIGRLGGNHAYLWDTTANNGQGAGYGMGGSSGSGGQFTELGPGHDAGRVVPGNEGREAEIIAYMEETKNTGMWFPGINDCHNKVDRTLSHFGLENPGALGGRFGAIPNATSAGNGKNF
ncbi:MAG: RHS repeat-associated core domain-containing protein [Thermodesulfobacteriota bacterium]|nr:RHS repeat-associated core domain-containing protein [Thermodesulfobacteriota bacterium]